VKEIPRKNFSTTTVDLKGKYGTTRKNSELHIQIQIKLDYLKKPRNSM